MEIVNEYLIGLKQAYSRSGAEKTWSHFENIKHGSTTENIKAITTIFAEVPNSFLQLLDFVDGTYWREYQGEEVTLYVLGSDVENFEYPYYLLSSKEVIENNKKANTYFSDAFQGQYLGVEFDEKIKRDSQSLNWLHFADCMNNGGTSSLYIDFSPSEKGAKGQIVRFLHDPDEFKVIANSFDEYLKLLIENDYKFINEDFL